MSERLMPTLRFFEDNFLTTEPIFKFLGVNDRKFNALEMLLISWKTIYFSKSYSWFTTVSVISYTHFFSKNFSKNPKFGFFKILKFFDFHWLFNKKIEKWFFEKSKFWIFWKVVWKYFFWKSSWVFLTFGCNFSKIKYFYLNPKAYQAACPWL